MRSGRSHLKGFTLIELMISLAIGATVTGAGLSLYVQMSSSRNVLRAELALQENSYFIDQAIRQLVNQAGHRPLSTSLLETARLPIRTKEQSFKPVVDVWQLGEIVKALDNGLSIRFEGVSDASGEADASFIDCQGAAIAEGQIAEVTLTVVDNALLCTSDGVAAELLGSSDGVLVEQIAVEWGVDIDNDDSVDEFRSASNMLSATETLSAVRVLLLISSRDEVRSEPAGYTFNGVDYSASDLRLRQEKVTTVQIRN